jgi:hypothetical protein
MTNKLTLTESMSQLRQRLQDIEQGNINEGLGKTVLGQLEKVYGKLTGKAAEEALVKELGEKVTITNEKGQVQNWILRIDDTGAKYHLEGKDARIRPEDMKARKAAEPKKEPSIPPEVTEPHPTLLGPDGKPLQVPAKPKPAITDPVVKAIADVPISTDVPEIVNMGRLDQYLKKERPDLMKKLDQNPVAKKKFYNNVISKSKTKKVLAVAAIIALLIYFLKDDKKEKNASTANAGAKTSEDGSSPIGTVIPADQIDWTYFGHPGLNGSSLTKDKSGVWRTPTGQGASDPKLIARIEEFAKLSPEQRQAKIKQDTSFFMYDPSSGGGEPDIATSQSAPVPTTTWGSR